MFDFIIIIIIIIIFFFFAYYRWGRDMKYLQYFATPPPPPPPPGCNKWRLPILDLSLVTWVALSFSYENTIIVGNGNCKCWDGDLRHFFC